MPDEPSATVSQLLREWAGGSDQALKDLLPLVYQELRRVARQQLRRERPDHTLQSTALVHEAYLRLLGSEAPDVRNRPHFIAVASRLIRQILVDYARERNAAKRDGGHRVVVEFLDELPVSGDAELLALNDALNDLYRVDERQARIVDMKFFGGLSSPEVSEVLGLSRATVDRDWATARAWLHRQMTRAESR
jgi:RNA polymerase sigma factor (TIGR02999 family)